MKRILRLRNGDYELTIEALGDFAKNRFPLHTKLMIAGYNLVQHALPDHSPSVLRSDQ